MRFCAALTTALIAQSAASTCTANRVEARQLIGSRNWHRLVRCTTIPSSYYTAPTEQVYSGRDLRRWFESCAGVIWLRLSSSRRNDVATFIQDVLPHMKNGFRLITSDGDNSVPRDIHSFHKLLDSPLCTAWYAAAGENMHIFCVKSKCTCRHASTWNRYTQNYDGSVKHAKLRGIPIGFDLEQPGIDEKQMWALRSSTVSSERSLLPLSPWWSALRHGDRLEADLAMRCPHKVRFGVHIVPARDGVSRFVLGF